jgi:membrane-anchored protein YejM (alkaline phosphatase superfamily)
MVKLGQRGINFNHAISPGGWTYTSFSSILTGKYPSEHGVIYESNINKIKQHQTLPQILSRNNVSSASFTHSSGLSNLFGCAGMQHTWKPTQTLFDRGLSPIEDLSFEGSDDIQKYFFALKTALKGDYPIQSLGNLAHFKMRHGINRLKLAAGGNLAKKDEIKITEIKRYLSKINSSSADHFFMIHLSGAHYPWEYKREMVEDMTGPISTEKNNKLQKISNYATNNLKEHGYVTGFSESDYRLLTTLYKSYVHEVDSYIQKLVDVIESLCLRDQTVIIITSDHGKVIGKGDYFGHRIVDDHVTHVPLIIEGRSVPTRQIDRPVSVRQLFKFVPKIYNNKQAIIGDNLINTILSEEVVIAESYGGHVIQKSSQSECNNNPGHRLVGYSQQSRGEIRFDENNRFGDYSILEQLEDYIDSKIITKHE